MSIPGSGSPLLLATTAAAAAAEYVIPKSLRFNSGDSAHLSKTFSTAGNQRTWTWSAWIKRSKLGATTRVFQARSGNSGDQTFIQFRTDDKLYIGGNSDVFIVNTDAVFRDPGAWGHLTVSFDTTQSTAANRIRVYWNGNQLSLSGTQPSQNYSTAQINSTYPHSIGNDSGGGAELFNGYLADIQFVDGQALAPTDFGETRESDGVWVPKEASLTSPNDGTTWSSDLTATSSGAYFATGAGAADAFDGNLDNSAQSEPNGSTITWSPTGGIAVSTSLRVYRGSDSTSNTVNVSVNGGSSVTFTKSAWVDLSFTGTLTSLAVSSPSANPGLSAVEVDGEILLDDFNNSSGYGRNGFHLNFSDSSTNEALGFDSAPTTPDPDPKKGMDIVTYAGNGGTQNIGGLNFEPGLVWIKRRDGSAKDHCLVDVVRGPRKRLRSESVAQETDESVVTAFDPGGFTIGNDTGVNQSSYNYVAWTWAAGGSAVANTDGTVTSQVSANTDYGFSIVGYTGTGSSLTIGHGLNTTPSLVFIKNRSVTSTNWQAFVDGFERFELNTTGAEKTDGYTLTRTSTTISPTGNSTTDSQFNASGNNYIAYCWSEVSGYSKFGTYTGGSATQSITGLGFKPRFVILKRTDSTSGWFILDSERGPSSSDQLYANLNFNEQGGPTISFDDDGFTFQNYSGSANTSGGSYIYIAFADRPGNNWDVNNIVTNEGLTTSKTQFDVVTYTGNGTTQSITSLAFQPDLVWIKDRSNAYSHRLADSVRGSTRVLFSDQSNAEQVNEYGTIDSFNSDGFTLRQGSNNNGDGSNTNNANMVAWCWKAGGTAVSNTDGSITSSVSANAQYGFSIVTYTGTGSAATVGHGLSSAPSLLLVKQTNGTNSWAVYSRPTGASGYLSIEDSSALNTSVSPWNSTDPTSSVFSIATAPGSNAINRVNLSGQNYVAYCFANVPGYQRIGSYTGSGSSGNKIVTGFKPRFLLIKRTSTTGYWNIVDSERGGGEALHPNLSNSASSGGPWITFSNDGFTLTTTGDGYNDSGATFIYLAIGDDEIGSDEDCLVDVPNAVTADADATDTTGGYQRGNYATFNPIEDAAGGGNASLSNGNLQIDGSSSEQFRAATIAVSSGKWYFEIVQSAGTDFGPGVWAYPLASPSSQFYQNENYRYNSNGGLYDESAKVTDYSSFAVGDVIGTALDMDNGKVYFSKNGVWQNNGDPSGTNPAASGLTGQWIFGASTNGNSTVLNANFGQMRFKYPMPSGYAALNTTALPAATIADGSDYFDTVLYTGNGTTGSRSITGLSFAPDFSWFKGRSYSISHLLYDSVRGAGSTKSLVSNGTNTEGSAGDNATFGYLESFDSSGFSIFGGSDVNNGYINKNSATYASWHWDAGSSTASNTDGSITSSVRVNQTAGFSIVSWTGTGSAGTIGHGLNSAPELIIGKNIGNTTSWIVGAAPANDWSKVLFLNSTSALTTNGNFNDTAPTSSVFSVGTGSGLNQNTKAHIAYCFTSVAGYQAIGSWTGNGSTDGPFVYTGFRPSALLWKPNQGATDWVFVDAERNTYNVIDDYLLPNSSAAEGTLTLLDFCSNGFKLRTSSTGNNTSGTTVYYIAWAENPFQANGGLAR